MPVISLTLETTSYDGIDLILEPKKKRCTIILKAGENDVNLGEVTSKRALLVRLKKIFYGFNVPDTEAYINGLDIPEF